jgi:hypothetical protein
MAYYEKDENGQWWYYYGKDVPRRSRAEERKCERCAKAFIVAKANPTRFCSPACAAPARVRRPRGAPR